MDDKGLNFGRRQRVRDRFVKSGLSDFEDHEVLELLLFYAIPRADTNRVAHRLMNHFGCLSAVLEAPAYQLQKVEGIGQQAALLLSLVSPVTRRYHEDRVKRSKTLLDAPEKVGQYLQSLMFGLAHEVFYVLCLDPKCKLLHAALVSSGTVKEARIQPRLVVEAALQHNASSVILAHNHPSGECQPSAADHAVTQHLKKALSAIDIDVLDHMIVANDQCYSFAEHHQL